MAKFKKNTYIYAYHENIKIGGQVSHSGFCTVDYPRKSMYKVWDAVYVGLCVSSRDIHAY